MRGILRLALAFALVAAAVSAAATGARAAGAADRSIWGHLLGWEERLCDRGVHIQDPEHTVEREGGVYAYYRQHCGFLHNLEGVDASTFDGVRRIEETVVLQWAMRLRLQKMRANLADVTAAEGLFWSDPRRQELLLRVRAAAIDLKAVQEKLDAASSRVWRLRGEYYTASALGLPGMALAHSLNSELEAAKAERDRIEAVKLQIQTSLPLINAEPLKSFITDYDERGSSFFDAHSTSTQFTGFDEAVQQALRFTADNVRSQIDKGECLENHPGEFFKSESDLCHYLTRSRQGVHEMSSAEMVESLMSDPEFSDIGMSQTDSNVTRINSVISGAKCRLMIRLHENAAGDAMTQGAISAALVIGTLGVGSPFVAGASMAARIGFIGLNLAGIAIDARNLAVQYERCRDLDAQLTTGVYHGLGDAAALNACQGQLATSAAMASIGLVAAGYSLTKVGMAMAQEARAVAELEALHVPHPVAAVESVAERYGSMMESMSSADRQLFQSTVQELEAAGLDAGRLRSALEEAAARCTR